jgi:hypothetical protein
LFQASFSRRNVTSLTFLLPLGLLAAACGDDAGGSGGSGAGNGSGGNGVDDDAPTVRSTAPADGATDESPFAAVTVRFSEAMAPGTLTDASFTLDQGTAPVPGTVSYAGETATFVPSTELALDTTYTATIATTVTDLAGNELADTYTFSFTTDDTAPLGPAPVLLRGSGNYVVLAKAAVTNVPTSLVTGDIGLSPAAASYVTGLSLTRAGTHWTSAQVVGRIFAADNDPPTPTVLTTAVNDMQTAYTDAAGRPTPGFLNLQGGDLVDQTLAPGLYRWESSVTIPTDLALAGAPNDVWIFQITGDLSMAAAKNMLLVGGARSKNVFWQVAGEVGFGANTATHGIVLSKTGISLGNGASISGRLLAQTEVKIESATVTAPAN